MSKKRRILIAFIDYDNVDSQMRKHNESLDFAELMKQFLEIGEVDFAAIFVPFGSYHSLPKVNNLGFEIVVCQKMDSLADSEKREDKVDSRMAIMGISFLRYKEITDFVILTHDKHIIELASEVIKKRKTLTFFAYTKEMGRELKDFVENFGIAVRPLPAKPRLLLR
ncbi:NYN domain-containing protein [Patescibacteria group bacterium]|nr:NYN domain-containing protein [Patescibacteria group bacterium]MBU4353247.1 NYN domain-containing protein [Patescibacteria group bacterium]MBU4477143.1 NYN domain-containing protein [Patescibacteria group bacterium]MCG2698928.1 NYN domain-containing protein [Candidatus Parcubacteria bacterium]